MLIVAVALTAMAVGQDMPSPDSRAMVEALLKRSRELEAVRFCVPQALWKQYLREQLGGPGPIAPAAPVPWIAEAGEYRLAVAEQGKGILEATVRIRVFDAQGENKLAVLSAARAWKNLTLAAGAGAPAPVELPADGGFLRFSPPAPGLYILRGQADVKGDRVALDIPPTVRTLFQFAAPPGLEGRVEGQETVIPAVPGRPAAGALALPACKNIVMTYGPPPVAFERAPRYQLQGTVAWTLDADVQHVSADLAVDVLVGRSDRIDLALPAGADRVKITGPEVRDVQGATVFLRGRLRGQVRLNLEFDLRYGPGSSRTLTGLGLREGRWTGGTLLIAGGGGDDEVLPERAEGLAERTLADLPAQARAMLRGQPVAAYGVTGSTWSATVEALKLGQFVMRESIADLAHYQVAFGSDGVLMCKAQYELRNRSQQFLRLALPPGAIVLLARVNEKAQPLVPLPERPGVFVLPLVRSDATVKGLVTFPVEIVYMVRTAPLGSSGTARLPLPALDIPIAYVWGEVYLPEGLAVTRWGGPMQQVDQFSSETAVASIGYGAGELAAGYKAEGRIQAETAGKKADPAKAVRMARPPSGKPGWAMGGKAKVVEMEMGTRKEGGGKDAYAFTLGKNYWRTGQEYYQQGNYDSAETALRKVTELAPGSQDAANASKLLANIDVVRGQAKLTGAQEKAAGKSVQQEAAQQRQELVQKQSEQLTKGFEALKAGKRAEAQVQFQAAQAYNTKLVQQGEAAKEQDVLLAEARKEMETTAAAEQAKARELIAQARQLSEKKDYSQALTLAKTARQKLKANEFGVATKLHSTASGDAQQAGELVEQMTLATAQDAEVSVAKNGRDSRLAGGDGGGGGQSFSYKGSANAADRDKVLSEKEWAMRTTRARAPVEKTPAPAPPAPTEMDRVFTGSSAGGKELGEASDESTYTIVQTGRGSAYAAEGTKVSNSNLTLLKSLVRIPTDKPSPPYVYVYRGGDTAAPAATPPPAPPAQAPAKAPVVGSDVSDRSDVTKDRQKVVDGTFLDDVQADFIVDSTRDKGVKTGGGSGTADVPVEPKGEYRSDIKVVIKGATVTHESKIRNVLVPLPPGPEIEARRRAAEENARRDRLSDLTGRARGRLAENVPEDAAALLTDILKLDPKNAWASDALARASRELRERIRPEAGGDQMGLSLPDAREARVPWYYEIAYPADWRDQIVGREGGRNENKPDGSEPIVERTYDIKDMLVTVPNFAAAGGGTDFFGGQDGLNAPTREDKVQRAKSAQKVTQAIQSAVDPASWRELERITGGAIQISNGQLIVRQREDNQKKIAALLGQLRDARGARVQEGEKLLTQAANADESNTNQGLKEDLARPSSGAAEFRIGSGLSLVGGLAGQAPRPEEALANDPEFQKFVGDNYRWANDRNKPVAANAPASQPATPTYDNNDLAQRLLTNRGQKTHVVSWNVNVDEASASRVGLKFNAGNNDLRYAVVDEAQLRTLAELEASRGPASAVASRNPSRQDAIIGTDALLANGMTANTSFAADRGNVLDVDENPIALAHERYLVVSNGKFLTAVRSLPMANWKEASPYVAIIEAPQKIEIPRVGVPVRFEKKLAGADEALELIVTYQWKGAQ